MKLPQAPAPQSVQRILGIIDLLSRSPNGEPLAAIARALAAPKNSIVGLLAGMMSSRHVTRDEKAVYRLGPAMYALAGRIRADAKLPGLVRPALERLAAATGETALAGTLAPDAAQLVYIERAESTNPIRYSVAVGERRELHCTAMGKLLLAFMDPEEQVQCLARIKLEPLTRATVTSPKGLQTQLERIRSTGIASTRDERIVGASAFAAAVVDAAGRAVVGLGVIGPSQRMRSRAAAIKDTLVQEARAMSQLFAVVATSA